MADRSTMSSPPATTKGRPVQRTLDEATAYREAKERGLPDGWKVSIDKRNRRKWTAPNGRSCDSIPKAMAISVEIGLLPPDTVVTSGSKKRKKEPSPLPTTATEVEPVAAVPTVSAAIIAAAIAAKKPPAKKPKKAAPPPQAAPSKPTNRDLDDDDDDDDDDSEDDSPSVPLEVMQPERALDPRAHQSAPPRTVHWDPDSNDGNKVGWKIRIQKNNSWVEGRVVRYDPYYHKHKIVSDDLDGSSSNKWSTWIWLRNKQHNIRLASDIVWAHVKGYAWWPALVMTSNKEERPGYVLVDFFASGETASLKLSPDTIRPFRPDVMDAVVEKHKKKRNAKAFDLARQEYYRIRETRNQAAIFYAQRGIAFARRAAKKELVAKRISLHRHDVNYPYGETLVAKVRTYSPLTKKWLLTYELSEKTKTKYDAGWINLIGKDVSNLHVLSNNSKPGKSNDEMAQVDDIVPFVYGYEHIPMEHATDTKALSKLEELPVLLKETCRGCVEYWKKSDARIRCDECETEWHLACYDPPLTLEAWQKMIKDGGRIVCPRCTICRGCYQKDIVFGCQVQSKPTTLSLPKEEPLQLCYSCVTAYSNNNYCSNCAHSYDSDKLEKVTTQLEALERKRKFEHNICDSLFPLELGSLQGDDVLPHGAKVDPMLYRPETSEWGYGENEMLVCDECDIWIHAGCAGVSESEYDQISDGKHPVFSKEFLCRVCCRKRCKEIIQALQDKDAHMMFATPVTEKEAPNYFDVIKAPMDLETMLAKAENEEYLNYAWVREDFELMVLNALIFNHFYTHAWHEAKRYYGKCLDKVFKTIGKAAPPSKHAATVKEQFQKADEAKKNEENRVQVDKSVEKKDLVAGTDAVLISLPKLRASPPDHSSCIPFTEVKLRPTDAFYCSWMDCCYTCGSSGAMDTMIFCCDCGEAFHTFCVNAPIHSMDLHSFNAWRCPSCKVCEISGQVPEEETRMLFCEMCDRAFTLDLLDPPLASAPPGLWICGQCVDCKACLNNSEPDGPSLKHWSCDPEKCFRCGGCNGLGVECGPLTQCMTCSKYIRENDLDIMKCRVCKGSAHALCEGQSNESTMDEFLCRSCCQAEVSSDSVPLIDLECLSQMSWIAVEGLTEFVGEELTASELHYRLTNAVEWKCREQWRESYKSIIFEALRLLALAEASFEDARVLVQHALSRAEGIPIWMIHRAYRFVMVARRNQWASGESLDRNIESMVMGAKLAASFLKVAQAMMNNKIDDDIVSTARFQALLEPAGMCGIFSFAHDSIQHVAEMEALLMNETKTRTVMPDHVVPNVHNQKAASPPASPLCGWPSDTCVGAACVWKDPRTCALCGLSGDDDAGFDYTESPVVVSASFDASLGRLLPFNEGLFVHSGCAIWSSETWENAEDSRIHGVDKARSRGSQLKCFGCGRHGATVGCSKSNCLFNYHFPCAKACDGTFTADQHLYCSTHKAAATSIIDHENSEPMKALMIAAEGKGNVVDKAVDEYVETDLCSRVGTLIVHSFGDIETKCDGFHSEHYVTPPGYVASRIFWSTVHPRKRTVYVVKIERAAGGGPVFTILPGDNPSMKISLPSASQAYNTLLECVRKVNADHFNIHGDLMSKLPVIRRSRRKAYGLNGPQFFGFGVDFVRKRIESSPGVEALVAPLVSSSPIYQFCFVQPSIDQVKDLQRKRAAAKAERALENNSGCARTEGMQAVDRSGGSGRITRALVRNADEDVELGASSNGGDEAKAKVDRSLINAKYKRMKAIPIEQRLAARRSHIHGWGLFSKMDVAKDQPIVEYMGEVIRQPVADIREKAYEVSGEGSCYMFRLDMQRIVDATKTGCLARFMNHSCQPNAYAKIVLVDTDGGQDKKIVVFANRDISSGEEITYDYKFPVEDGSLRCTCGAANCIGRLN